MAVQLIAQVEPVVTNGPLLTDGLSLVQGTLTIKVRLFNTIGVEVNESVPLMGYRLAIATPDNNLAYAEDAVIEQGTTISPWSGLDTSKPLLLWPGTYKIIVIYDGGVYQSMEYAPWNGQATFQVLPESPPPIEGPNLLILVPIALAGVVIGAFLLSKEMKR